MTNDTFSFLSSNLQGKEETLLVHHSNQILQVTTCSTFRWWRPSQEYSTWFNFISPHANFCYDPALESLSHIQPISLLLFLPFPNPPWKNKDQNMSQTLIKLSTTSIIARNMAPHCTYNTIQIPYGLQAIPGSAPDYLAGILSVFLTPWFNSIGLPSVLDRTQLILTLGLFTCCWGAWKIWLTFHFYGAVLPPGQSLFLSTLLSPQQREQYLKFTSCLFLAPSF